MISQFHKRLARIEDRARQQQAAPTFPILDKTNFPDDAIEGQLAITTDDLLCWFSSNTWFTVAGSTVPTGNGPQDVLEGQCAIGSDNSFCWYSNGSWHCVASDIVSGNTPQDPIEGQVVLGSDDSVCWYSNGDWRGLNSSSGGATGPTYIPSMGVPTGAPGVDLVHLIANRTYLFEEHWISNTSREIYIDGVLIRTQPVGVFNYSAVSFGFGFVPSSISYPDLVYFVWDLNVGSSRGASDVFSSPLNSLVSTSTLNVRVANDGTDGLIIDTLPVIGQVSKFIARIDSIGGFYSSIATKNTVHFPSEVWTSFNIQFPDSTITQLLSTVGDFRDLALISIFSSGGLDSLLIFDDIIP